MTQDSIPVQEPFGGEEIVRELRALHARSRDFWSSFSITEFFHPLGGAWSPADNVRHLLKSNRPVLRALSTPKILLALRFGAGLRASRTYSEVRERYLTRLAEGVTAGRFAPKPLASSDQNEEQRSALMADLDQVSEHLTGAVSGWREWQLDRLRLPHPALGRLTVREMLFFTLYHNLHHVRNVERRLMLEPGAEPGASVHRSSS
ncbi:MAG TPA: DinB family protein [Thermoanaerobaculia bacterium]|nr:DinB family protein [Thermoanaerobaculia bacterium]